MKTFDESREDLKPYGLTCELWKPSLMRRPDRHNEIEINYMVDGSLTYLLHDRKIQIEAGGILLFWALLPHQIVDFQPGGSYYVITIPFGLFAQWNLHKQFLEGLHQGEAKTWYALDAVQDIESRLGCWVQDLDSNNPDQYGICMLEIEAFVKRLILSETMTEARQDIDHPPINLVEQMAIYIAENFTSPIMVTDVAEAVGLNPDYANHIFKKAFSETISQYLNSQRIMHAKRMLSLTKEPITQIAFASGFNSISRFNSNFRKHSRKTPSQYRQDHRHG